MSVVSTENQDPTSQYLLKTWKNCFLQKEHQVKYVCGDFNRDLLNKNKHKMTNEFTDVMHSLGLRYQNQREPHLTLQH